MSIWQRLRFLFRAVTTQDIDDATSVAVEDPRKWPDVLWLCDRYLKKTPQAILVVLARARCYQAMNLQASYKKQVAFAVALDDTFVPALYQQLMILIEENRIAEALDLLAIIKDHAAVQDSVDGLISNLCMRRAQAKLAREYQIRSWMANFDNLRFANMFLFGLTYVDIDEATVAQEHQFWSQTLLPLAEVTADQTQASLMRAHLKLTITKETEQKLSTPIKDKKRIAYWGGDFKEHSVRYFSRPLIESHNRDQFEVFIYDDNPIPTTKDQHTQAIKNNADYYFDVSQLTDSEVVSFIDSHRLDILVEIQGHTSTNRLHLWQKRFAPLQITGLAYPPTTGLSTIDYKMVDIHMLNSNSHAYYTERQMVMPHSFWCFDPKEDAPYTTVSPHHRKGYLTLGCLGNGAKISPAILAAWGKILKSAKTARLLVVSHTFDKTTEDVFRSQAVNAGIPLDRLECKSAVPRDALWLQYQEVDLILDTHPFNGGTTTCWATYAGVPVLTLAGNSLASCMGKSVMSNLGFPEFVVENVDEYVTKAIALTLDPAPIDAFRAVARERFVSSSLGNGKLFAQEFEALCTSLLAAPPINVPAPDVPPLPLPVMLDRARMVWYHGNADACRRILKICRQYYGNASDIVEYEAELLLGEKQFDLLKKLCSSAGSGYFALWHLQAQASIATDQKQEAQEWVRKIIDTDLSHATVSLQLQQSLWQAWMKVSNQQSDPMKVEVESIKHAVPSHTSQVLILVVGHDAVHGSNRVRQIKEKLVFDTEIEIEFCQFHERIEYINEILVKKKEVYDLLVIVRDHIEIVNAYFLYEIQHTLLEADVVSLGGALRWTQKDWTKDLPEYKAWGLMRPSKLAKNIYELYFSGANKQNLIKNACVLDGQLLAFVPSRIAGHQFNEEMGEAGYWAEEDWTNRINADGGQLVVHRSLGVVLHPSLEANSLHTTHGQKELLKRLNFDPIQIPNENYQIQTVQVLNVQQGMDIAKLFLSD